MSGIATGGVLAEVAQERMAQDAEWGGPEHDDMHGPHAWVEFIDARCDKAFIHSDSNAEYRRRMIQIAALAVAAVESLDRSKA
jgi:hypothetical protein